MRFPASRKRPVSLVVLIAFAALLWAAPLPAPAASAREEGQPTVGNEENPVPGFQEKDGSESAAFAKSRKFPWLVAVLGAVAAGVVVYLLVHKKKKATCALTVTVDAGSSGTPAASGQYEKGAVVPYSYAAKAGYGDLLVMLDGAAVAASGSIVMDRDHSLVVGAAPRATLRVDSTPAGARIYLDSEDSGQVTPYTFIYPVATAKTVLLRHSCGYQDWTQKVSVGLGQESAVHPALAAGLSEDFVIPASDCWQWRNASAWTVSEGLLQAVNATPAYEFALHRQRLPASFTIIVRQRITQGTLNGTLGVIFSTDTRMDRSQGYEFAFIGKNQYVIYKNNDYDHYNDQGPWSYMKFVSSCPARKTGRAWNIVKIVKSGSNYTYYVNGQHVFSFVHDQWDVRYVSLGTFENGMKVDFDWVVLSHGDAGGSIPGQPLTEIPAAAGRRRDLR